MRVALVVDNPARDLPGLVLLSKALSEGGATCLLVPSNLVEREVWALEPDLVLVNYLRQGNDRLVRELLDAGVEVALLDTEGGIYVDEAEYATSLSPCAKELLPRMTRFFGWGPRIPNHLVAQGLLRREQIRVTGAPRFDLYHSDWRRPALRCSAADRLSPPVVLINASFPLANPRFVTPEEELRIFAASFDLDLDLARSYQVKQEEGLEEYLTLSAELAAQLPHVTFVLRPHPFERIDTYTRRLAAQANLQIRSEGTVDGWILASVAVIQRGSTTAIEAALADVPSLNPTWVPTYSTVEAVEAISTRVESLSDLIAVVDEVLAGTQPALAPPQRRAFDRIVGDWFHRHDGGAHLRIAEEILACLRDRPSRVSAAFRAHARRVLYDLDLPSLWWIDRLKLRARSRLRLPAPAYDANWLEQKAYTAGDVRAWLEALCTYGPRPARSPDVEQASDADAYAWGYSRGRSVIVHPVTGRGAR